MGKLLAAVGGVDGCAVLGRRMMAAEGAKILWGKQISGCCPATAKVCGWLRKAQENPTQPARIK